MNLTIVIPTADRHEYLSETLSCLSTEIERTGVDIPVIISDNASHPPINTDIFGDGEKIQNLTVKRFDSRVQVGESIVRSSRLAETDYVWVFGDDDLIVDGGLKVILDVLAQCQPDFLYINRFIAPHDMKVIERTEHVVTTPFVEEHVPGVEAIRRFTHHAGFITSLVVKKGMFDCEEIDFEGMFPGYGFLASLYYKTLNGHATYISAPLLVQRKSRTLWRSEWPRYWLVSVPSMFQWLEDNGASGAYEAAVGEVSNSAVQTAVLAKAVGISSKDVFWNEAISHQPVVNKILLSAVRCLVHRFIGQYLVMIGLRLKSRTT